MDQLKDAVAAAFDNIVASGAIEAALQEQVGKAITSAIKDQIGGYNSDFTKKINERVKALIDVNLDEIDLPCYRQLVADIIKKRVGAVMTSQFTEQLDKDIAELLEPAPAEITLHALLEEFIKHNLDYYRRDELRGCDFTFKIERHPSSATGAEYVDVYIDAEPGKYAGHDVHLRIKGAGEVWGLSLSGRDLKDKIFVGPLFAFEKRLFQMYTAKTRLIIPADATADDYTTTFPHND
ncbi:hypothetical protein GJ698_02445 [Pseudoduganella sp. FT26W]|uniref:Uncharacterized protein n=1 Tax=Duganella aquatilis TaxID=2666082 RepID=A0A844D616_9BURK|nr:hypothetical protein [Duganella aquatilis]MRW82950.1 hypothetical protein [Duganella aquatilis]